MTEDEIRQVAESLFGGPAVTALIDRMALDLLMHGETRLGEKEMREAIASDDQQESI